MKQVPGPVDAAGRLMRSVRLRCEMAMERDVDSTCMLIVDDNPGDRYLLIDSISESGQWPARAASASTLDEACRQLATENFDVILLDLGLPDSQGLATLERMLVTCRDTPVVVLTCLADEALAIDALRRGAQDYIVKGATRGASLMRAVRQAAERGRTVAALRRLDRLKSELVSTASHELRTPMSIIREFVSLVADGAVGTVNDDQLECLNAALRNCDRLTDLVSDLLDMARIDSGALTLRRRHVDLLALVRDVSNDFLPTCRSRNQTLIIDLPEKLPQIVADPARLQQVLVNLIGNAHKFAPDGGHIAVSASVHADGVRISVRDNGRGISPDMQSQIFEAFRQLDASTSAGARGTGLGLTITRSIVDLHGGRIGVESAAGGGACFTVTLPLPVDGAVAIALMQDIGRIARMRRSPSMSILFRSDGDHRTLERILAIALDEVEATRDAVDLLPEEDLLSVTLQTSLEGARDFVRRLRVRLRRECNDLRDVEYLFVDTASAQCDAAWWERVQGEFVSMPLARGTAARTSVLVVDDDPRVLEFVRRVLAESFDTAEVYTTTSGFDACVQFGERRHALVIVDAGLPDIHGRSVYEAVRRVSSADETRVMAISGDQNSLESMLRAGCDDGLTKPFEAKEFVQCVGEWLGPPRTRFVH